MKGQKLFRKRQLDCSNALTRSGSRLLSKQSQALDHIRRPQAVVAARQIDRAVRSPSSPGLFPHMRAPACALRCWGCHMGCVFFGQAHGELRLSDLIVSQSKGNRHAPLAESKSTVFRIQINLTSLCHRGIGRSIGDRSAVPARGGVKTALVIICDCSSACGPRSFTARSSISSTAFPLSRGGAGGGVLIDAIALRSCSQH